MKAVKVTNAAWIPALAEHIEEFCKRAHVDGIQPGNLQTYFAQVAQLGHMSLAEFWIVLDDADQPCAFACWNVSALPNIAKVYCLAVYSWTKDVRAADLLADEFVKFGDRHNARWWSADFLGKATIKLVSQKMAKRGFTVKESGITNVVFRRQ